MGQACTNGDSDLLSGKKVYFFQDKKQRRAFLPRYLPAVKADPSEMFEVSLKGLSVPLTSWWSLLIAMGP